MRVDDKSQIDKIVSELRKYRNEPQFDLGKSPSRTLASLMGLRCGEEDAMTKSYCKSRLRKNDYRC